MTKIEKYESQIALLNKRYNALIRTGNFVKAIALKKDISEAQRMLDEFKEALRPKDISEVFTKEEVRDMGIIPLLTEIHLAADYLISLQYKLDDLCDENGIILTGLQENLKDVIKRSDRLVSDLMSRNGWLLEMMSDNDTLNEALHKKVCSFIKQHTKKPRKSKKASC